MTHSNDPKRPSSKSPSPSQISEIIQKLKAYEHDLRGKAVRLKKFEEELKAKEQRLREYRKQILIAVREEFMHHPNYEEQVKILEKFRDILEFVVQDIQGDIDEIMG